MNVFAQTVDAAGNRQKVLTENGAVTFDTSESALVDLFFAIGGARQRDISQEFAKALSANENYAARILLWGRDARGGAGERETVRKLLVKLEEYNEDLAIKLIPKIPFVGRWDDLLVFKRDRVKRCAFSFIAHALAEGNALCAKWMPREKQDPKVAKELREYFNLTPKAYRKLLTGLTKVVETQMCNKDWGNITYSHVPSVAAVRYMKAFRKHDAVRYGEYLESVKKGEQKINTSVTFPHDVIRALRNGESEGADVVWDKLPDYVPEGKNFLPIVDSSGSMLTAISGKVTALDIAVGLGIYLSQRNKGDFKDLILQFAGQPKLYKSSGSLSQRYESVIGSHWDMSTNLQGAFEEILRHANKHKVSQKDMPQTLIILSDMEFNSCVRDASKTNYEAMKVQYEEAGYNLPNVVFWNITSRQKNLPVRFDENGTALVSGYSPAIMKNLLQDNLNPFKIMLETVSNERYNF